MTHREAQRILFLLGTGEKISASEHFSRFLETLLFIKELE